MVSPPRVVIAGAGFTGVFCARKLEKKLSSSEAEIVIVSPTNYLQYSPLLPEVACGNVDERHIAVPVQRLLKRARYISGSVAAIDLDAQTCRVDGPVVSRTLEWDRLVLTPGAITRNLPIPGLEEYGRGFKTLSQAIFLRDHVLHMLQMADLNRDPAVRPTYLTFVVVGAGYAGTEFAAQMQLFTRKALAGFPRVSPHDLRWILVNRSHRVMPELGERLSALTLRRLRERGIEVMLGANTTRITEDSIEFADGTVIPTRTVVWCAGVRPAPIIDALDLPTEGGRLVVEADLSIPGHPHVFSAGDSAACPDLHSRKQEGKQDAITPPTAQHAYRQGKALARNIAASLGHGKAKPYRHYDMGLVVDLGGAQAVAKPLHLPMSGLAAKAVTVGYHLMALPTMSNRIRVGADMALSYMLPRDLVRLGLVDTGDLHEVPRLTMAERSITGASSVESLDRGVKYDMRFGAYAGAGESGTSDLVTRAELVKLASALDTATSQVGFLEPLGADSLALLRQQISAAMFDGDRHRFGRLAELARTLPEGLVVRLAERVFRALITAHVAGLLAPEKAIRIVRQLPVMFVADAAVDADPRYVRELAALMEPERVASLAAELVERGDLVTIGRFLDVVTDEAIVAVLDRVADDEAIVRALFFADSPERLDRVIELIPPERLRTLVHTAITGTTPLRIAALSFMARVSDAMKLQLGDLATEEPDEALSGYVHTAVAEHAVPELLLALSHISEPARRTLAGLSAFQDQKVLDDLIYTVATLDYWSTALPIVDAMEPELQKRVMDIVRTLEPDALRRLVRTTRASDQWSIMLSVLARQDATTQQQIASAWQGLEPEVRSALEQQARDMGLEKELGTVWDTLAHQT